ncbi:S-layer homology domain-containing protein [Sporosarcina ureae]|uniref:S-layer homology domain-containing protein n=1 Tax=Sporosarcina ureae TaxID=1571 RepID=UPI0026F18FCF|nr:S-layer homology domain-containing protein [Sporosarcina ureae]
MKRKLLAIVGALLIACSSPLSSMAASKQPFPDVPATKHFAKAVNELAERNIIGGYPDGTFKPGNNITRGQAAAIIAKMIKLDMNNVKNPGFKDVTKANGYYNAIAALAEAGIIGGYEDGRYGPNDPVKRGQFASILVKAFDLPRYSPYEIRHPFKDVSFLQSHDRNILILYKLGITTGTSPDKFSVNEPVTRGQAAKLMKTTEEVKPPMTTITAADVGVDRLYNVIWKTDTDLYESIEVYGKPGYTETKIQLLPLKEGKGTLNISGAMLQNDSSASNEKRVDKKFYVHNKLVNGKLQLTLEETEDYLPTEAELEVDTGEKVKSVRLSTVSGKLIATDVTFNKCSSGDNTCIKIDQPGEYIATVRFAGGNEVRYAIEAKLPKYDYFHYDIKTLRERVSYTFDAEKIFEHDYSYDHEAAKNIGKHTILTKNAESIATVTRTPGTNVFHVTAKSVGTVEIKFENIVSGILEQLGDGMSGYTEGMYIHVQEMYGIVNVSAEKVFVYYSYQ